MAYQPSYRAMQSLLQFAEHVKSVVHAHVSVRAESCPPSYLVLTPPALHTGTYLHSSTPRPADVPVRVEQTVRPTRLHASSAVCRYPLTLHSTAPCISITLRSVFPQYFTDTQPSS
jgi:hypothetical protein